MDRKKRRCGKRYKREELIQFLIKKAEELGRMPTTDEVDEDPLMPWSITYSKKFGGWHKVAEAIGYRLPRWRVRKKHNYKEAFKRLKEMAQKLGRIPRCREMDEAACLPSLSTIIRHFGGVRELSRKLNIPVILGGLIYEDKEILKLLKQKADKLGRAPTTGEVHKDEMLPSSAVYQKRFGSYTNAVRLIGYKPYILKRPSFEKVKEDLLYFYHKHKKAPTIKEFMKVCDYHFIYWLQKEKMSWGELLDECGFPVRPQRGGRRLNRRAALFVKSLLIKAGHSVVDLSVKGVRPPYNFLVNDKLRLKIMSGMRRKLYGRLSWMFILPRKRDFDYLIGVGADEKGEMVSISVFPVEAFPKNCVIIPVKGESKYSQFRLKNPESIGDYFKQGGRKRWQKGTPHSTGRKEV